MPFAHGKRMIHTAEQFRISKSDSAKGSAAQNVAGSRLSPCSEKETRSGIEVGMPPTVQDDTCDVPLRIKPRTCEHIGKLFADHSFVIHERRREQPDPSFGALLLGGQARIIEGTIERKDGRRVRPDRLFVSTKSGELPDLRPATQTLEPTPARNSKFVQKSPISHGHVGYQACRPVELAAGFAVSLRKVSHDVRSDPTASGHDNAQRFQPVGFAALY